MNKPKSILDFFKSPNPKISCPACGTLLQKCNLNAHLDYECASSSEFASCSKAVCKKPLNINISPKKINSVKLENKASKLFKAASKLNKSSRLSLKDQRKHLKKHVNTVKDHNHNIEIEVITLDDDSPCSISNNLAKNITSSEIPSLIIPDSTQKPDELPCTAASQPSNSNLNDIAVADHYCKDNVIYEEESKDQVSSKLSKSRERAFNINVHSGSVRNKVFLDKHTGVTIPEETPACISLERSNDSSAMIVKDITSELVTKELSEEFSGEILHNGLKSTEQAHVASRIKATDFNISVQKCNTQREISSNEHTCDSISTETSNSFILKINNNISFIQNTETNEATSELTEVLSQTSSDNVQSLNSTMNNNNTKCVKNCEQKSEKIIGNSSVKSIELNSVENSDIAAVLQDAEVCMEEDDNVFTENSQSNKNPEYSPYYIANFKHIVNTVLNEEYNKILFNEEDMTFIKAFETSSDAAQKLYVRLFQRKYKWLRLNKINYPNITNDPGSVLDELANADLVDSGSEKIDLETALDLLSLPEAKTVLKQFNFNSSNKNKSDIIQMLLKHCKEHKSVFFTSGRNHISNTVLKKVKQVLGPCYRISLLPKRLFTRILMLFSLPTLSEDDDDAAGGQQQQLLTLLQVNKGEITFPDYKINRQTMIFIDRDELIRYEEAKQLENDIINAVENKNFDLAKELYINAKEEFEDQLLSSFVERAASLPTFLKKFTSFHIYVRCMTQGVEILQRLRQYKEAVELLKKLLNQKVFCQDYRGRWSDRLALNLEQHLKQRKEALEVIKQAIKDKNIRKGYQYSLLVRALRILKTVDEEDELEKEMLGATNVIEAPKVVIKGRLCPRNILGRRHVFISSSSAAVDEDDVTILGVEQLAIEHYKSEGFSEGIHGEGSTFHALYGLLFWDIIYDGDIPDAFISPYQTHPLDLNHDAFFARREKQIMNHLEHIRKSTIEEVKEIVKSTWEAHFGQTSLVAWDRFTDVDHVLGLVACMGTDILCGICERLARDFRFSRSGVPDLVVWNPDTLLVKIVEVKGPGDKLSSKQILWLDYLLKLGASAEVCHVEAVGSKRLRKE